MIRDGISTGLLCRHQGSKKKIGHGEHNGCVIKGTPTGLYSEAQGKRSAVLGPGIATSPTPALPHAVPERLGR
jgi:hypothetical protein